MNQGDDVSKLCKIFSGQGIEIVLNAKLRESIR
jgi:hypothetical protein